MSDNFKPAVGIGGEKAKRAVRPPEPEFLFVTASLAVLLLALLLSVAPQASHANGDMRVGKLIGQSAVALHVDALRSIKLIHAEGRVAASGLSGSGDTWNEMGGMREASLFSTP